MDLFPADKSYDMDVDPDAEQIGGGYGLCPSIKRTPKAKRTDDLELQKITRVAFVEGGIFTGAPGGDALPNATQLPTGPNDPAVATHHGWENIPNDCLLQLASDGYDPCASKDSHSPSPPSTPTPRARRALPTQAKPSAGNEKAGARAGGGPSAGARQESASIKATNRGNNGGDGSCIKSHCYDQRKEIDKSNQLYGNCNCKDNGEDSNKDDYIDGDNNDGNGKKSVKPTRGRCLNVVRNSIEATFQDIRAIFRKVSDATGFPISTLRSKFHDLHTTNTMPTAWRMYKSYFHNNKEKEQARHRDEGRNAVPDAKGTPLSSFSSQLAHYSLVAKKCWQLFQ
ncbi:hypothetical protein C0991_004861 [Blastosporella zonata]|nr:hypothetical protein C0991_004861 [Blastosporella zonata]